MPQKPLNSVTSADGPPRAGQRLSEALQLRQNPGQGFIVRGGKAQKIAASAVLPASSALSAPSAAPSAPPPVPPAGFTPGAVQAPAACVFDHADYAGASEYITWRATNAAPYPAGEIAFYGWQASPDGSAWAAEAFAGDTFQGPALTSGSQYARVRAYPLVASGVAAVPSGWVTSSAQAYAAPPAALTVQELSTGKSFAGITTLQFPDGTLTLTSAGIVRYTPLSGGAGAGGGKSKANGATYAAGIARWLCNDPASGTALVDSISPPGNNLSASASGLFGSDTVGEYFAPGGTGYANGAGNAGLLTGQGDFSFEHYIQTGASVTATTFYGSQSDMSGSDGGIVFEAGISNSQFTGFLGTAAGGGAYYQLGSPQPTSLYHVAVVYTASNMTATVYVNGAAMGTQAIGGPRSVAGSSTVNRLGDRSIPISSSTYRWAGKIYFASLYARALPASEVSARYTAIG